MKKLFILLCASSILSSCQLIPDYKKPEPPVAEQWDKFESISSLNDKAKQAAASIAWRDFFKSKNLQDVIETTIKNNRDLRTAILNVDAARALYRIEKSSLLPKVDANINTQQTGNSDAQVLEGFPGTSEEYNANIAVTAFEVDLFGKLRSKNAAALEIYLASEANSDAVRIALIAETANAYLQWLADRKILKITEETLAAQEKSYGLTEKSYKAGMTSKLALAQARTAVETAKVNKSIYTRNVIQDKNALVLLMGVKDASILDEKQTLDNVELQDKLADNLTSEVLLLRPDIRRFEHELKSTNANIGAARAAFFPTISITGSFGLASGQLSDLFSSSAAGAWSFVPQVTVPIFKAGENQANLKYSEIQRDVAISQYEKSIQVAFREIANELVAKETLHDQLDAQRELAKVTKEAYELSTARYNQGIDSFLNVLDAERSLYIAQQNEVEVEKLLLANLVNLYKSLGGGIE